MTPQDSELAIRAAALYLPITIGLAFVLHHRPAQRRVAGVVVAVVWNLVALLVLNIVAQGFGWWTFGATRAVVAGVPVDLWIGWALLWGVLPLLATT